MNKIKHLPVNWTEGMKISKKHLWESYFSSIETIKNYNVVNLNQFNYGILACMEKEEALSLDVSNDANGTVVVKLKSCNLITQSGYRIIFSPELYGNEFPTVSLSPKELAKDNEYYYVVATISPFEMTPIGVPNPDVEPLFHPSALPKIKLNLVAEKVTNSNFISEYHLIIGRLVNNNSLLQLDEDYIPPVARNRYHSILEELCESLSQTLFKIKNYAFQVYKRNKDNPKSGKLADNTFVLCDDVLNFYAEKGFCLKNIILDETPIALVELLSSLSSRLSVSFNLMNEKEREMLLQYYYEWTDINPYRFIEILSQLINVQYDHTNINASTEKIQNFISLLELLFKKMSELEYIGQRKDNIVISEEKQKQQAERRKRWDIID